MNFQKLGDTYILNFRGKKNYLKDMTFGHCNDTVSLIILIFLI